MNTDYNKLLLIVFASFFLKEVSLAEEFISESSLISMESISWTEPIRNLADDGSMIASVVRNPSAIPLFFPKLVSLFEFMDRGDPKFYTLEQLALNPRLGPRPVFRQSEKKYYSDVKVSVENEKVESLENRLRELEAKLLEVQTKPVQRPNDDQLKAFILEGNEHLSAEQRFDYLSKVISEAKHKTDAGSLALVESAQKNLPEITFDKEPLPSNDFLSLPMPPTLEESEKEFPFQSYPLPQAKSVVRFKASVPTPQGTHRPAQASDLYLTTQNLHDLFGDLNLDHALAGEVKSVAELWASAEKGSSLNPEIALGVKSILLQAKVGKTRTDPFGEAELDDVSPDDDYFLIGIDKDDQTGVVTIWSKPIEVTPGENMVELTANDVIYHE